MRRHHSHFIHGTWVKGSGSPLVSLNPATQKIVWEGTEASQEDVDAAVNSAKEALKAWSSHDLAARIYHMHAFRDSLTRSKDMLAEAISKETGKPLWESKTEVTSMINKIAISIEAYSIRCPEVFREQSQGYSVTRHRPHGILAVLGPYNFPGHLPNGHIIPALLAGNTIIFKPSELTPLVGELTIECWEASGLPKGVINLIQGGGKTGEFLSKHPLIDGLLFTGSWKTGKLLAENFAKTPQKVLALEMGGNNPLVIGSISDMKTAAYLTIQSAFLTSGQRCSCARRLIIPNDQQGDKFLKVLIEMMQKIKIGAYNEHPEPFMGPVISQHAADALLDKQSQLIAQGGFSLLPMNSLPQGPAFLSPGLIDVTKISKREDEEIFGPLLQVIRVPNFESAIDEANDTRYGLTAGLFSNNEAEYHLFFNRVKAGVINWNMQMTGASSSAPFGGVKQSGNNRPSAFYAADYCAYPIASLEAKTLAMPKSIAPGMHLS